MCWIGTRLVDCLNVWRRGRGPPQFSDAPAGMWLYSDWGEPSDFRRAAELKCDSGIPSPRTLAAEFGALSAIVAPPVQRDRFNRIATGLRQKSRIASRIRGCAARGENRAGKSRVATVQSVARSKLRGNWRHRGGQGLAALGPTGSRANREPCDRSVTWTRPGRPPLVQHVKYGAGRPVLL